MKGLLTIGQVSEILCIPQHRLNRAMQLGKVPVTPQWAGRVRVVPIEAIDSIRQALVDGGFLRSTSPTRPIEEVLHVEAVGA